MAIPSNPFYEIVDDFEKHKTFDALPDGAFFIFPCGTSSLKRKLTGRSMYYIDDLTTFEVEVMASGDSEVIEYVPETPIKFKRKEQRG